jgi:hypothetical protein
LENDLGRLREWGVEIEYGEGVYRLISYAGFNPVALGEDELNAVALLAESFGAGAPLADEVQQLLRVVVDWLPARQRDSIPMRRQRYRIDLRRTDTDVIAPVVEAAIHRAISERRLLNSPIVRLRKVMACRACTWYNPGSSTLIRCAGIFIWMPTVCACAGRMVS